MQSEIALFIQQWDEEMEAIQRGLKGYAITARHDFITRKMQSFGDERIMEMMRLEAAKMNLKAREAQNSATSDKNIAGQDNESL